MVTSVRAVVLLGLLAVSASLVAFGVWLLSPAMALVVAGVELAALSVLALGGADGGAS